MSNTVGGGGGVRFLDVSRNYAGVTRRHRGYYDKQTI